MTLPGLVMLVLSQVVMVLVISLSLFLVIDDFVEGSAQFLGGATALAVIVVDALVLTGVIGRGWPPSTETNTELLLGSFVGAALLILAVGIEEDEVGAVATGIVGLILIGLGEGLLLAGLIWPQHHVTAEPPTLGATTAPGRTPAPTVTVIRTVTATR